MNKGTLHQEIHSIGFFRLKPETLIKAERRIKLFDVNAEYFAFPRRLLNQLL